MIQLFDAFGREIKPAGKPIIDRTLAVAQVEDRYTDYPSHGLTPKRLAEILKEADAGHPRRQLELFEEMEEKDTHLMSVLGKRRGALTGLKFNVMPFSQEAEDVKIAEFVEEQINALPDFEDNLKDITDAIGKGFSSLELNWAVDGGRNVIKHLSRIEPKRFIWPEAQLTPRLLTRDEPANGIDLVPFKFLFHIHKAKSGHPVRQGVLRVVTWMYLFKNYDIKAWVAFGEVFGMPLRLGRYDPGATKEDKDALISAVRALGSDAAGIISKSTEIEFIEAAQQSGNTNLFKLLADFCNAEISKAVLGQTLTTEQGDRGARSLGDVHKDVQDDILRDDCEQVSKSMRRDLIQPLVGFNFGWDKPLPWFRLEYEDPGDLKAEAERYRVHLESGLRISADHYYDKFQIPKPEKDEDVLEPRAGGFSPPPGREDPEASANKHHACPGCGYHVNAGPKPGGQDTLDGFTDRLMRSVEMDGLVEPIREVMGRSSDLEEFRRNLIEAFGDMETDRLAGVIEQALIAAELSGRFEQLPEEERE